jgi:hypothetical protein
MNQARGKATHVPSMSRDFMDERRCANPVPASPPANGQHGRTESPRHVHLAGRSPGCDSPPSPSQALAPSGSDDGAEGSRASSVSLTVAGAAQFRHAYVGGPYCFPFNCKAQRPCEHQREQFYRTGRIDKLTWSKAPGSRLAFATSRRSSMPAVERPWAINENAHWKVGVFCERKSLCDWLRGHALGFTTAAKPPSLFRPGHTGEGLSETTFACPRHADFQCQSACAATRCPHAILTKSSTYSAVDRHEAQSNALIRTHFHSALPETAPEIPSARIVVDMLFEAPNVASPPALRER